MRDILTSPQIIDMKRKRKAYHIRLGVLLSIFLIILIGSLAYLSSYKSVTIHTITVSGTRIINTHDVEESVQRKLSGRYFYLFSRANTFIYPQRDIYDTLRKDFPRIEKVEVYKDSMSTLRIVITERFASYLYCGDSIPTVVKDVGDHCYFINTDGYIFDKAPYFSGNVYFKYYMPIDGSSDPLGKQMISPDNFHKIVRFVDSIETLGFKPIYLSLDSDGLYTLYLDHGALDSHPTIIFKKDNDFDTILDNLHASMQKREFADEINSKYTTLLYIDLRFTNKVLYKFQ
jgi:hypothetical protein